MINTPMTRLFEKWDNRPDLLTQDDFSAMNQIETRNQISILNTNICNLISIIKEQANPEDYTKQCSKCNNFYRGYFEDKLIDSNEFIVSQDFLKKKWGWRTYDCEFSCLPEGISDHDRLFFKLILINKEWVCSTCLQKNY